MLSDEEIVLKRLKETLDVLKGKNVIGRIDFQIRDMVEDCIRVIEKQSKEIEELKKLKYVIDLKTNEITKLTNDFVSKDKIKAKIEEEDKLFFKTKDVRHANRYKAYKELLEKE